MLLLYIVAHNNKVLSYNSFRVMVKPEGRSTFKMLKRSIALYSETGRGSSHMKNLKTENLRLMYLVNKKASTQAGEWKTFSEKLIQTQI